jgi:N-acetylglucosamine-6-phosphate deacetylase
MKCQGRYIFSDEQVEIEFDRAIAHVDPLLSAEEDSSLYLAPGFIDLQVNGFAGVDYNSPSAPLEATGQSIRALFSTGVTRFFPTVITGAPEEMLGTLRNLSQAREKLPEGPAIEAFHVEGPHISPEDGPRGAHPARWVRPPDLDEYQRWQEAANGNVRLITLSPEWPDALRYIEHITRDGVVASIGHTRATREQIQNAVSAGATLSTHLGNAADAVRPREPNYLWEQLAEDRLAASFIADGLHLPDAFLRMALRSKGIERAVLITGGSRLAGSSLRMDRAIENTIRMTGATLRDAVAMATTNPSRIGRVPGRWRGLQPGQVADIVKFQFHEGQIKILETYLAGQKVYP